MQLLRFKFLILLFGLIVLSSASRAELYFEPHIGYGKGTITSKDTLGEGISENVMVGPAIGAKFGLFYDYLYLTLDLQAGLLDIEGQTSNSSAPLINTGFSIGWDWNIPVRLTYTLDSAITMSVGDTSVKSTGSRLALGYYLDINTLLSIVMLSSSGSTTSGSDEISTNLQSTLLTISFPYEFLYPATSWKEKTR